MLIFFKCKLLSIHTKQKCIILLKNAYLQLLYISLYIYVYRYYYPFLYDYLFLLLTAKLLYFKASNNYNSYGYNQQILLRNSLLPQQIQTVSILVTVRSDSGNGLFRQWEQCVSTMETVRSYGHCKIQIRSSLEQSTMQME